jgi:hypothetical protein
VRTRVRGLVSTGLISVLMILAAAPAHAHQPVTLGASDTTPARGPLLVDGTVSFAVTADIKRRNAIRGFRVQFRDGDRLELQVLVPDRPRERAMMRKDLPLVTITAPSGRTVNLRATESTPFLEPYSGTSYLYIARWTATAEPGIHEVTIRARAPIRATVAVGYREVRGRVVR